MRILVAGLSLIIICFLFEPSWGLEENGREGLKFGQFLLRQEKYEEAEEVLNHLSSTSKGSGDAFVADVKNSLGVALLKQSKTVEAED